MKGWYNREVSENRSEFETFLTKNKTKGEIIMKSKFITQSAIIAAMYVVLTLAAASMGLANGAVQVDAGTGKLVTYMGQLTEGAETLSDGADTLASGMATFNKTGIQKLVSTLKDSDIKSMVNRVKATLDAASDGSFIGGKQDGQSGESKIILKTDEVKKASKSDK